MKYRLQRLSGGNGNVAMPEDWTAPTAPRIFRSPAADFQCDEPMDAPNVYTSEELSRIASHGFNGVWLRGRLRTLMASTVFPELNDPLRESRLDALRIVIERGRQAGIGVYLFFNDPLALTAEDPFWIRNADLSGEPFLSRTNEQLVSLCLSHPQGAAFLDQAADSVLAALPELAGVILITASEHHSHCWSHRARYGLDDGFVFPATQPMRCMRCAQREPAELVSQIVTAWRKAADRSSPRCRIVAWNWSWSMWYPEPQEQVVQALPPGVIVMADWERGGRRPWRGRDLVIDEYSLGYPGPSERFVGTYQAATRNGNRMLAKLQIGTTHEVATVPNLPLLQALHAKLAGLTQRHVGGFMGTWNFGCMLTLNTYAVKLFATEPQRFLNADVFLDALARDYFGVEDASPVVEAWRGFSDAFDAYPFHIRFLYFSPVNDAPAHPLSLRYEGQPLGGSWVPHDFGDRLEDCLGPFTCVEVAEAFDRLQEGWRPALMRYREALSSLPATVSATQRRQAAEELRCAEMLALQFRSTRNLFRFHETRARLLAERGLQPPCVLPRHAALLEVMRDEVATAQAALPLVGADSRLGYHQEARTYMYSEPLIREKLLRMQEELEA